MEALSLFSVLQTTEKKKKPKEIPVVKKKPLSSAAKLLWKAVSEVSTGNEEVLLSKRAVSSLYFYRKDTEAVKALWELEKRAGKGDVIKQKRVKYKTNRGIKERIDVFSYVKLRVSLQSRKLLEKTAKELKKMYGVDIFPENIDEDERNNRLS